MEVYRVSKKEFSGLDGLGGLYFSGRWHDAGHKVVYTAQHRSLAALEYLVHLSSAVFLLTDYVITTISIPDEVVKELVTVDLLSPLWTSMQRMSETRKIGTQFLVKSEKLILQVPSAIIPEEVNFIINPNHPQIDLCKIIDCQSFKFDSRLVKQRM